MKTGREASRAVEWEGGKGAILSSLPGLPLFRLPVSSLRNFVPCRSTVFSFFQYGGDRIFAPRFCFDLRLPPPPHPPEKPDTYLCLLKLAHGFECSSLLLSPGGTPHLKRVGMFVVPLRGVDFGFWSHLGCSGQNAIIFS